jgi:ABC-type phosphate/phosphonate transport system substrate-binding protein
MRIISPITADSLESFEETTTAAGTAAGVKSMSHSAAAVDFISRAITQFPPDRSNQFAPDGVDCRATRQARGAKMRAMSIDRIAALPMYDLPHVAAAHAALWHALASHLQAAGVEAVPEELTRDLTCAATWRHPRLLLGQACEYPLAKSYAADVQLVATPRYHAPGCAGSHYRSAIVVRAADAASSLADLRQRRCVINEPDSNSGMNLLRAAIAPLAGGAPFFASVAVSGSHWNSARAVAEDRADVAAIDCVSYAHLQRGDPALIARLRVLGWTGSSPSLPYITARATDAKTLQALRDALAAASLDVQLAGTRAQLLLQGFEFSVDATFRAALDHERHAAALGYPELR